MKAQLMLVIVAAGAVLSCCLSGLVAASSDASSSISIPAAARPFSALAARARHTAEHALAPIAAKVLPCVPPPVLELVPIFAHGAASLVMVGRGVRTPPPAVSGAKGDEVLQHTTAKFVYAAGAIVAELALLKLVYREPYRNQRKNRVNSFFATAAGFFLLVLLTALPNDLMDTSLMCVFYFKLSSQVYMPAVVCGQLLSVYLAALVPALPPLSAAYTAFLAYWADSFTDGLSATQVREAWTELILALVVMGAFAFSVSARRGAGAALPLSPQEPESDGDDYYAE
ncbi:hypothetical protein conserved [Leishmania donovani]|uniref:Uncharacterized protein n=3 Tax=Leishmania donovani species complex TaxID=38574 RepID=A4I089_LEIIN|nr:conserved hypothetical protein [Leishmania infantum JPCM5]XP_003860955.1 hypothetical protein, conserved [Leishmania donovani]CAC9489256.1 hypothetical_protein_-_conserved [Leishmania infantum]AYU78932.1 hypothetical protein LdCL_230010900 [Leishmania donovani]TPP50304.1 hypothetical protein CGC21_17435 [Leishmania donovani]TPP51374.1 hypothetical protein CGC20_18330 [Leishmania donovani]CAJ1988929.1 hypothetical protein conserved [Leishmania donovani]|eukprot:XP_001465730.1 conserved hypothetical protein [Leishmania infantum JPCM5]